MAEFLNPQDVMSDLVAQDGSVEYGRRLDGEFVGTKYNDEGEVISQTFIGITCSTIPISQLADEEDD